MYHQLKIRRIGDETVLVLSPAVQTALGVGDGDTVTLKGEGTSFELTAQAGNHDEAMKAYTIAKRDYQETLRELAK